MKSITMLRTLTPDMVAFHAERYTSGKGYEILIQRANGIGHPLNAPTIATIVREIARSCETCDGADYGNIPCLGGEPLRVWEVLRRRYC